MGGSRGFIGVAMWVWSGNNLLGEGVVESALLWTACSFHGRSMTITHAVTEECRRLEHIKRALILAGLKPFRRGQMLALICG